MSGITQHSALRLIKKVISFEEQQVTLLLWISQVQKISFLFLFIIYREPSGYLVVIDGTRKASLECALDLIQLIEDKIGSVPYIPVINKSDLTWEITTADVTRLLGHQRPIFQSSAKTGENVEKAFLTLAKTL